jgi:hypothetical protein
MFRSMKTNITKLAGTYLSKAIAALKYRNYRLWFIRQNGFLEWLDKLNEDRLNPLNYTFTSVLAEEKDL